MIWRVGRLFSLLLGAASLVVIAIYVAIYLPGLYRVTPTAGPVAGDFSRTDFIVIMLTAVTVVLGSLAIILAVAGAVGYATLRGAAEAVAREAAAKVAVEIAGEIASERADLVANRVSTAYLLQANRGTDPDPGDAIARAEGGENVGNSSR